VKAREAVKLVEADGWVFDSQKGSHMHFKHPTKPGKVTIPNHAGKDLPKRDVNSILKQAGLK
jgi:predicted RNA binding protein YcfA (HicA-like mRNA interferase family)